MSAVDLSRAVDLGTVGPRRRLNGITPPVGTILGPDRNGELWCVREVDGGCRVAYATTGDMQAAGREIVWGDGPRSVTEYLLIKRRLRAGVAR